jgi:hypothetical protein
MNEDIYKFCKKFEADIRTDYDQPRYKANYNPFDPEDPMYISGAAVHVSSYRVPMVNITMPEDKVRVLAETVNMLDELLPYYGSSVDPRQLVNDLLQFYSLQQKQQKDAHLRSMHPPLQDLWEQYNTMKSLVR